MNRTIPIIIVAFLLVTGLAGCAATPYEAGERFGYSETRLSEDSYQVRFQGNAPTWHDRVSQFVLRRCAELTLEHGRRYFTTVSTATQQRVFGYGGTIISSPFGQVTIKMLNRKDDMPNAIDAVIVIHETSEIAEGKLSSRAQKTLDGLQSQ
jgi:hypothetical protein